MESLKLKKMDGATCLNDFQSPFSAHSVGVHFSYVSNTDFAHREYGITYAAFGTVSTGAIGNTMPLYMSSHVLPMTRLATRLWARLLAAVVRA